MEKDFQEQIDNLRKEIESLKNKQSTPDLYRYEDIKFYPNLKVDNLYIKFISSTASDEPTIPANVIMLWGNTTTNQYYLKANFNGVSKKVSFT